jgi:hypothetical protein
MGGRVIDPVGEGGRGTPTYPLYITHLIKLCQVIYNKKGKYLCQASPYLTPATQLVHYVILS